MNENKETQAASGESVVKRFRVVATGYVGSSIFSPNLRGEKRTYEYAAESEEAARQMFDMAVADKVEGVIGASGSTFKIQSIEEIESV